MNIGDRIRLARKNKKCSLDEIASSLKISRQTLSRYETGVIKVIPSDRIEQLATVLDVSPAYLMGWDNEDETKKEAAPETGDSLSPLDARLMDLLRYLTTDQKKMLLAQIETLLRTQE